MLYLFYKKNYYKQYFEFSKKTLYYPNSVSTIDSFINTYITLPFYYLSTGKYERPNILDENSILDTFRINELWDYKIRKHKHDRTKALDIKQFVFLSATQCSYLGSTNLSYIIQEPVDNVPLKQNLRQLILINCGCMHVLQ